MSAYYAQQQYDARYEWDEEGVRHLAPHSAVVIIVDVLTFSTAVNVAVERGATAYPHRWHDASAADLARELGAQLAVPRTEVTARSPYSLSPASLAS